MRRALLYGFGITLLVGAFGLLVSFSTEAIVLALSCVPVGVFVIAAASRAPPIHSPSQAIVGWLLGVLALGAGGIIFIGAVNLGAFLRRQGLIGIDIGTAIAPGIGLFLLGILVYLRRFARRASRGTRRKEDRREHKVRSRQENSKQRKWWEVLEVDPKTGPDEIRHAYLHKVQMYHPDRLAGLAPELVQLSESRMLELNLAFEQAKRNAMKKLG